MGMHVNMYIYMYTICMDAYKITNMRIIKMAAPSDKVEFRVFFLPSVNRGGHKSHNSDHELQKNVTNRCPQSVSTSVLGYLPGPKKNILLKSETILSTISPSCIDHDYLVLNVINLPRELPQFSTLKTPKFLDIYKKA